MDETEYLTTPANAAHLARSIQQDREGGAQVRELMDDNDAAAGGDVSGTLEQSSNGAGCSVPASFS